jgi:hypothetical protein
MSRLPHYLDNRFTDGSEVSRTPPPPFTSQENSWYSFLLEAESTPGPQCDWQDDLIGNRIRDLRACSTVLQTTTLPRAPSKQWTMQILQVKQTQET